MANDRLYLACTACNQTYLLAKYWGGGQFRMPMPDNADHEPHSVADFLEKHGTECHEFFAMMDIRPGMFALRNEDEDTAARGRGGTGSHGE